MKLSKAKTVPVLYNPDGSLRCSVKQDWLYGGQWKGFCQCQYPVLVPFAGRIGSHVFYYRDFDGSTPKDTYTAETRLAVSVFCRIENDPDAEEKGIGTAEYPFTGLNVPVVNNQCWEFWCAIGQQSGTWNPNTDTGDTRYKLRFGTRSAVSGTIGKAFSVYQNSGYCIWDFADAEIDTENIRKTGGLVSVDNAEVHNLKLDSRIVITSQPAVPGQPEVSTYGQSDTVYTPLDLTGAYTVLCGCSFRTCAESDYLEPLYLYGDSYGTVQCFADWNETINGSPLIVRCDLVSQVNRKVSGVKYAATKVLSSVDCLPIAANALFCECSFYMEAQAHAAARSTEESEGDAVIYTAEATAETYCVHGNGSVIADLVFRSCDFRAKVLSTGQWLGISKPWQNQIMFAGADFPPENFRNCTFKAEMMTGDTLEGYVPENTEIVYLDE